MKGILGLLARAKLIELSEEEQLAVAAQQATSESPAEILPDAAAAAPAPTPTPPPAPVLTPEECAIGEGRSLEEIFISAGIPPAPFPAEKLLRLLDGLRAMDAATRKAAVLAMDAADDSWQVTDCIDDAQRKMAALDTYKQLLAAQVQGSEQQTSAQTTEIKARLDSATAAIRQQISELEQLLEREVSKAAQQITNLEAGLQATREAAARETRRMDAEIERLREIPAQFAANAAN